MMRGKDTIFFQFYYGDIHATRPRGTVTLDQFTNKTANPKNPGIFIQIAEAKELKNHEQVAKLKQSLPSFTPAVIVEGGRKQSNIVKFTGLAPLDWDNMTPAEATEFRDFLFTEYSVIVSSWLSASHHGVRAFILIPECFTVDEYKSYFRAIENEFRQYPGFDVRMKNPVQPLFFSHDPWIRYRENPDTWTAKADPPQPPPPPQWRPAPTDDRETEILRKIALAGLQTTYRHIDDDKGPGHDNVISIARRAGGFVGAGLFDRYEMETLVYNWIDQHSYLRKKRNTYRRTAEYFISEGMKSPLIPKLKPA